MKIGELAREAGVTTKAVRYYEAIGLLEADRLPNGYRDYDESDVRLVREVHDLGALGIRAAESRPFLECIVSGRALGDDCPDSLDTYRSAIDELDFTIAELAARRDALAALLQDAAARATTAADR